MSSSKQSVFVLTTVIFFSALLFVFPQNILFEHSSEILTVSTFLFAIFVGFYIAASLTNYTNLQKLVAVETSNLMALYDACRLLEPRLAKNVAETIDTYLISSFDFELIDSVEKSWGEFDEICKVTTKIKKKESNIFTVVLELIKSLQGSFRIGQYVDYPRSLEKKIKLARAER